MLRASRPLRELLHSALGAAPLACGGAAAAWLQHNFG
eukprot:gene16247-16427_t